jgi:branched-chain amino acid transport system permease protein
VFNLFVLQLLNGAQFGVLLFLIAAGLTLIFGIMDFVTLAHGVLYMIGAYLMATFAAVTGTFWLGLLLALPASLLVGLALEFLIFRRLYDRSHLDQVLATFGLVLVVNEAVKMIWGAAPLSVPMPEMLSGSFPLIGPMKYPVYRVAIIGAGLLTALGLWLAITRTRTGMLLRAGATHRAMVSALGINVNRLFTLVFAFGAMLAGFAGAIVAPILSVDIGMGESVLILAFVVIVIGGIGSIRGALVAALLVGMTDTLGRFLLPRLLAGFMDPASANGVGAAIASMLIYVLMAIVLVLRPRGLFGGEAA